MTGEIEKTRNLEFISLNITLDFLLKKMFKMTTVGGPSGTILAVHLHKCSHLSNEIRVMPKKKKKNFSIIKQLMSFFLSARTIW
jgi:hypothetical protein